MTSLVHVEFGDFHNQLSISQLIHYVNIFFVIVLPFVFIKRGKDYPIGCLRRLRQKGVQQAGWLGLLHVLLLLFGTVQDGVISHFSGLVPEEGNGCWREAGFCYIP